MKKHAATLLILMLGGLARPINAQAIQPKITARVPFGFIASGRTMPAGECTVRVEGDGVKSLLITCGKENVVAIPLATQSGNPNKKTVLAFRRYGGRYFLAGISLQGETTSYEFPGQKMETELRAQDVTEADVILLASHP